MTAKLLMTADEINRDQAKWLEMRRRSVGSSEIGVLLGLAPHSHGTPFSLWVEKKTGESLPYENEETERGKALESFVAADLAKARADLAVIPGGLYADENCPWMTASYDRFTIARDLLDGRQPLAHMHEPEFAALLVPAELKTALSRTGQDGQQVWGEPGTDEVPAYIKAQALWQMTIWDCDRVYVPAKFMGTWRTDLYVVERTEDTEADMRFLVAEAAAFLDSIERDAPPDIDWTPESARSLRTLQPMDKGSVYHCTVTEAKRLRAAKHSADKAKERYRLLQNKLAQKAGGAQKVVIADPERDGDDVTVMGRRQYPTPVFEEKRFREERPDLAAKYTKTSDVDAWWPGQRWMGLA
jgi:putative phage-type endonuclease